MSVADRGEGRILEGRPGEGSAKAAGASGWIVKPATADELINTIKLVMR